MDRKSIDQTKVYKVRIKDGAYIGQDFGYGSWPTCNPPQEECDENNGIDNVTKYPDAIFDAKWNGSKWDCERKGYGWLHRDHPEIDTSINIYGSGSIFVFNFNDVLIVDENNLCPHCGK